MEKSVSAEKPQAQEVHKQDLYVSESEWREYREVQDEGRFNMLDPNARMSTSLTKLQWWHIIKNYAYFVELYGR
jgi:hypothetical protein